MAGAARSPFQRTGHLTLRYAPRRGRRWRRPGAAASSASPRTASPTLPDGTIAPAVDDLVGRAAQQTADGIEQTAQQTADDTPIVGHCGA